MQGRINLDGVGRGRQPSGVAFIAFDLLREGETDWRSLPLTERRAALERLLGEWRSPVLRMSEQVRGDGRALHARAIKEGWEGLVAKRASSLYRSGKRTPDWRKLKIVHEQEFVVGGWTEPRQSRAHFGSLVVGVVESTGLGRQGAQSLTYAGHVGTGFDQGELGRVMELLKPLETDACPFSAPPPAHEPVHWVRPSLVAQIQFAEWTADGNLRHPVYLGLRDDRDGHTVRREAQAPRPLQGERAVAASGHRGRLPRSRRLPTQERRRICSAN